MSSGVSEGLSKGVTFEEGRADAREGGRKLRVQDSQWTHADNSRGDKTKGIFKVSILPEFKYLHIEITINPVKPPN